MPSLLGLGDGGPRLAVVSNPFVAHASTDRDAHLGVDLFYPRRSARDLITALPSGSAGGSQMFVMPLGVPALAASDGVVRFAGMTPVGNTVIIRHANGWATYYTHLATLAVQRDAHIRAGQRLGTIGASPKDGARVRHLHFELWPGGKREGAIDPAPYLDAWSRVTFAWPIESSLSPRNGTLSAYRAVGDSGDPYPDWVRALRGESGVYVIREIDGPIVYVGSSVGRLYETLTRHLQRWRRWKGYWRGQFGEGADPGLTYRRSSVEVAIKTTTPDEAHDEELRLIRRLQPRDNQLGQPELEDAPF
ncbi:MAG: peptidoglycan DD-metalloendopeptidase family protein [Kofleriaceae bacterium]